MRTVTRRSPWLPAIGLACAVLIAACGGAVPTGTPRGATADPNATEEPLPTIVGGEEPTEEPSGEPSADGSSEPTGVTATAPPATLRKNGLASVRVDGLRVRSKAGTASGSVVLTRTLSTGDRVYIVAGPVSSGGLRWYQVQALERGSDTGLNTFGWVASSSKSGDPWLKAVSIACPTSPVDLRVLAKLQPEEQLSCFGRRTIRFRGQSGGCGVSDPATIKPYWLDAYSCVLKRGSSQIRAHDNAPGSLFAKLTTTAWYEVTGHFDDRAASTCTWSAKTLAAPPAAKVVLGCRMSFVATAVKEVSGP